MLPALNLCHSSPRLAALVCGGALGAWALGLAGGFGPPAPARPPQDAAAPAALPQAREAAGDSLSPDVHISDLTWLEGTWKGSDGESDWESVYTGGRGQVIVGASKELKGGRVVMTDFEHFYERDGQARMRPYPFGKASVEFTLTGYQADARRAVFENPEHDFPRRFVYHRVADDRLSIALSGDMGGGEVAFTLDLRRADD